MRRVQVSRWVPCSYMYYENFSVIDNRGMWIILNSRDIGQSPEKRRNKPKQDIVFEQHFDNPKHPLCGALPVPYVPVRVTRGALIAHRYTYGPPRCRTSQYRRTCIHLTVSLWNDLVDPIFDGVGLAGFKSVSNAFLLALLLSLFLSSTIFHFSSFPL